MSRSLLASLDPVLRRVHAADRVLLALDFDGTLAPLAPRPEDAVLPHATAQRLQALTVRHGVSVAVLSGRSLSDLQQRLGLDCTCAGNHGLEIEGPTLSFVHPDAASLRPALLSACSDVEDALRDIKGAFVERKGLSATVHYRQVEPCLQGHVRGILSSAMRPYAERFHVLPAVQAWEIRPQVDWDKGAALRFILAHNGGSAPLVICAGDDSGDEPMFEAVPDAVSIRVGNGVGTAARYSVSTPAELAVFLGLLAR